MALIGVQLGPKAAEVLCIFADAVAFTSETLAGSFFMIEAKELLEGVAGKMLEGRTALTACRAAS